MPKRLRLEGCLSTEELERRYRSARDPVERSHLQIVWQLSLGRLTREVAEATGYSRAWIREVARRYNGGGPEALGDNRHGNPGAKERALLSPERREELGRALQSPPSDGGMWNSRKVAEWIGRETGGEVRDQRGWEYLRRLGYSPQDTRGRVPGPAHAKADPESQGGFRGK